ncbi:MAG TPA: hypothetical protein VFF15_03570 [Flavobacteriaceae bacterium]|nr:hypothetical protein [Flavobacteriaceae bacterium]
MSKNIPEKPSSEEVDLGQLFKLIGNAFERLFKFIGTILNGIFMAAVWFIFFIKKNFILLAAAALIGFGIGYVKLKFSEPVYSSNAVIKQNYNTGESLYNLLNYYNDLILDKDTLALSESLNLTTKEASHLVYFEMESVLNENSKLKVFDKFKREVDSTIAQDIDFETFLENSSDYDYEYQRLTVKSSRKDLLKKILPEVIKNIEAIEFFKNEREKDLAELSYRERIIIESLKESDSLQKVYQRVLEKENQDTNSQTSILINNAEEQNTTKEFELYTSDIKLRRELVEIQRKKDDIRKIVEVISSQQDEGIIDNTVEILDVKFSYKIFYAALLFTVVFLILLVLKALNYLERYKDKI